MKNSPILFFLFCFIITIQTSVAQEGLKQELSIKNFKLLENESNFFSGEKGLKCEFDVYFTEPIKDFSKQRYKITWRLENATGQVLFNSEKASGFHDKDALASADVPFDNPKATYGQDDLDIFIAYKDLALANGKNECKLILSATHDVKQFPNFWSKTITFNFKKVSVQPSDKQIFTVRDLKIVNGFGSFSQKLDISYDMNVAYGPGEIEDQDYLTYWQLLDANGKEIYNCNQDFFTKDKKIYLSSYEADKKNGGYHDEELLSVEYKYLNLSGTQNITFVLFIVQKGKQVKVHEQKLTVALTAFHSYKEQEFTLSNLKTKPTKENGVSGIKVSFDCVFKYHKIADESGANHDFYFYVQLQSSGKDIYSLGKDAPYKRDEECAVVDYTTLSQKTAGEAFSKSLFIPYFLLNAVPGATTADLMLNVSNSDGTVHFKELGKTSTSFTKPKTLQVTFDLTQLLLVDKDYDAAFGDNYINRQSDTQWFVRCGDYYLYTGEINENSNEGLEDKTTFKISEGDEMRLIIIDHDKLFNPSDVLANILLSYENKVVDVKNYQKGDVQKLSYNLKVE